MGKDGDGGAMVIGSNSPACTLFMTRDHSVEDNGGGPEGCRAQELGWGV